MTSDQCITCKHYTGVQTCPAFKDKIPQEITNGNFTHNKAHPKQTDKKILYIPINKSNT